MNVGNFVTVISMMLIPFAIIGAPILLVLGIAIGRAIRSLVQMWYTQHAMGKGAICYRNGDRIIVKRTK